MFLLWCLINKSVTLTLEVKTKTKTQFFEYLPKTENVVKI